jgi:glutamate racemase
LSFIIYHSSVPTPHHNHPIGLFDSGVGGGSVLREVRRLLPHDDLLYLADQAHCPYGPRPVVELQELTLAASAWLIDRGARLIVVACNTASAAALQLVRSAYPAIPFVGMVPAVKPAVRLTRSGVVGVLATPATIAGALLHDVIERWATGVRIIAQPCHGWVDLVERGELTTPEALALVEEHLAPPLAAGADTLVLGCTHYPFLAEQIRAIAGPDVTLVDSAPAVAAQVARLVQNKSTAPARYGQITYATTGDRDEFSNLIDRLALPAGEVIWIS